MRLGSTQHDLTAHIGEGAADVDPAPVQVDVTEAQCGGFAPAQAGVGQGQDQQRPGSGFGGQVVDLAVSEVDVVAAPRPWQAQATRRVRADAAAVLRMIQDSGHHEHRLTDGRGATWRGVLRPRSAWRRPSGAPRISALSVLTVAVRAMVAWARAASRIRSASRTPSARGWASLSAARASRAAARAASAGSDLPPGRLLDRYAGLLGTAAEAADPAR